ncbi:MAG: exodeoxyribonuclease VII small subunit [Thermoplasmatales archaeon]|jgi:exodeoxyribonuclease VII small subunit|nr:exodeoxyribonuclease VII small subunit [Thermoplasmatales archaeon]
MEEERNEKKIEEMTFEESLRSLEELVEELEAGGLDLDESLKIYENAIKLRDHCRKILEESERKVQKLMESASGTERADFTPDR